MEKPEWWNDEGLKALSARVVRAAPGAPHGNATHTTSRRLRPRAPLAPAPCGAPQDCTRLSVWGGTLARLGS